jgi:hypothetical protein
LSKELKPFLNAYVLLMVFLMIARNAEPIGHISPYPRVELSRARSAKARTVNAKPQSLSATEENKRTAEVERIWRLLVQAAEGH